MMSSSASCKPLPVTRVKLGLIDTLAMTKFVKVYLIAYHEDSKAGRWSARHQEVRVEQNRLVRALTGYSPSLRRCQATSVAQCERLQEGQSLWRRN